MLNVGVKLSKISMLKKITKKFYLFIKINLIEYNIEINIKFLKGRLCKIQIPIQQKFCENPGKRRFLKKILSYQLRKEKCQALKFTKKIKLLKKLFQPT